MEVGAYHDGFCDSFSTMWVIVGRLTKSAHFLAVQIAFTLEEFYRLYIQEIVRLHVGPVSIV